MLKSLSGSAEDIFSEESSLKEKYYKVKPTMTEERQKTVDNLFEQLSPSLKKQGQLNDLKKLIRDLLKNNCLIKVFVAGTNHIIIPPLILNKPFI